MNIFYNKTFTFFILLLLGMFSCGEMQPTTKSEPVKKIKSPSLPCPFGAANGITISYQDTRAGVDSIGAKSIHFWIHWDITEPEIFEPFFTVEQVTETMIEAYSSGQKPGIDWSLTDKYLEEFSGLTFVAGVGSGWLADMPLYRGKKIAPETIGRENYLGLLYLYTRSCVRRYGSKVVGWQIENEPNVALETTLVGIRKGKLWYDQDFMTEVLTTLAQAVRAEDPTAWVTINFHTDIHFEKDIVRWLPLIDVVGLDAYPNYFNGNPAKPEVVLERVSRAIEISEGKPVMVMETGYATAPTSMGFSEKGQKDFIEKIYSGIDSVGGCGIFYFKLSSAETKGKAKIPQENYWGLIREDGSYKEGWSVLKAHLSKNLK